MYHRDDYEQSYEKEETERRIAVDYKKFFGDRFIDVYGSGVLPDELRIYENLGNAISFAVRLSDEVIDEIADGPTKTYFHHYETCNAYLDQTAFLLAQAIMREGFRAAAIPASQAVSGDGYKGALSHKAVARICGLGGIGDNDLFLTDEYGCRVRLGTVLTDMPVEKSEAAENPCIHCGACIAACPCGALSGKPWREDIAVDEILDIRKCHMHMKETYQNIGNKAVCGICMSVCPVGKRG